VPSGGPGSSTQSAWNDAGQLSQHTNDPPTNIINTVSPENDFDVPQKTNSSSVKMKIHTDVIKNMCHKQPHFRTLMITKKKTK